MVVPRDRVRPAGPLETVLAVTRVVAILRTSRGDVRELEMGSESSISVLLGCWLRFLGRLGSE